MNFRKRHLFVANLVLLGATFIFVEYICDSYWCFDIEQTVTEPLLYSLIAFLPTTSYLMFFSEPTFTSWVKRVASWFFPTLLILVLSVENGQGLFPMTSDGRSDTAILMMTILFIMTLVYAPIVQKRLKRGA